MKCQPSEAMNFNDLKCEFRLTADGDDWGNCINWWFTIADEIHFNRENLCVPASWKFKSSSLGSSNDPDAMETSAVVAADDESLMKLGALIDRYARLLRHLGKDY